MKSLFLLVLVLAFAASGAEPLRVSVYATADDVLRYLAPADKREQTVALLKTLQVSRVFLEGRRGDEYVSPQVLAEVREFLSRQGIHSSGGIATVPGNSFGVRQDSALGWLNWESPKTRVEVSRFFTENAPVFDTLIVDDFYCTADMSPLSEQARGSRTWSEYRQDLLTALVRPMILEPARASRSDVRLIMKFPQWYDRFHMFGYSPARLAPFFDQVWVGTEVRNPKTRRMGYVQPTEGYMNFRWLSSVSPTTTGAWFDHIECSAENFIDQAFMSVLAGAKELTLFRLGDLLANHPGDPLLARRLPELFELAAKVQDTHHRGLPFYKPSGSDAADNMYLADYLGMIGLPILPVANYPADSEVVFLPAQAAADPEILPKIRRSLQQGHTVIMTPAFIRKAGLEAANLARVQVSPDASPALAKSLRIGSKEPRLATPLEVDAGVALAGARTKIAALRQPGTIPWLTSVKQQRGRVLTLNLRTFSEADFKATGEWLLAPAPLGLPELPQELCESLRQELAGPLALSFEGPSGIACVGLDNAQCFYNFRDGPVGLKLKGKRLNLSGHNWFWLVK